MILGAILNIIKAIALFILDLLPDFPDLSDWVGTSLAPLIDVIASANYFIDLRVSAGCLITMVVFTNIEFIWAGIMWIVRKIPGVS